MENGNLTTAPDWRPSKRFPFEQEQYDLGRRAFANVLPDATNPIPCMGIGRSGIQNYVTTKPIQSWGFDKFLFNYLCHADAAAAKARHVTEEKRAAIYYLPKSGGFFWWHNGFRTAYQEWQRNGKLLDWPCYFPSTPHIRDVEIDGTAE